MHITFNNLRILLLVQLLALTPFFLVSDMMKLVKDNTFSKTAFNHLIIKEIYRFLYKE
jgi:uncharacterized membrane protein